MLPAVFIFASAAALLHSAGVRPRAGVPRAAMTPQAHAETMQQVAIYDHSMESKLTSLTQKLQTKCVELDETKAEARLPRTPATPAACHKKVPAPYFLLSTVACRACHGVSGVFAMQFAIPGCKADPP